MPEPTDPGGVAGSGGGFFPGGGGSPPPAPPPPAVPAALALTPPGPVAGIVNIPTCFVGSGNVIIPQEDEQYIYLPSSGTNWTYDITTGRWQKTGGSGTGVLDAPATSLDTAYGLQPFYLQGFNLEFLTPAAPYRFNDTYLGVLDDSNVFYGWRIWKNCGANSESTCPDANVDDPNKNWKAYALVNGAQLDIIPIGVNPDEGFRIRSDGASLHWDRYTSSGHPAPQWDYSIYSIPLPGSTTFRFHLNSGYFNNVLSTVRTFKGSFIGSVPFTWTTPLGGTLTGTGNNRCFTSSVPGTYQVCISTASDGPICASITIADLYFQPIGFNCGQCVFTGETIKFQSNGGLNGTLVATGGLVIDPLTWQAPNQVGSITLTYTIGDKSVTCVLNVVDPLIITNVQGDTISGLIPGETFQITTNYAYPFAVWENLDCPNVVSPSGFVTIPNVLGDNCFGALDCSIRVRLTSLPFPGCDSLVDGHTAIFLDLRIIVDPVYPTPKFGGAPPLKWKPETPDFRVIVNEFEGGCDETYLRNRVPTMRWTVNYDGMPYSIDNPCAQPCCDDTLGFINGVDPSTQNIRRLDDFWMLVAGQAGYFTLVDHRTNHIWRRVRFDQTMGRDHVNWRKSQSRSVFMIWRPCCATEPEGGICVHKTVPVADECDVVQEVIPVLEFGNQVTDFCEQATPIVVVPTYITFMGTGVTYLTIPVTT